jgi:small nuclear ribonucleoprotein (snRNP)-like protein
MTNWLYWLDKRCWIILKNKKEYTGKVIDVDSTSSNILIWITILDKYGKRVLICTEEIDLMQESVEVFKE